MFARFASLAALRPSDTPDASPTLFDNANGWTSMSVVEVGGENRIEKRISASPLNHGRWQKSVRQGFDRVFHRSNAMVVGRSLPPDVRRHMLSDEATTLGHWRAEGIAVPEVHRLDQQSILLEFVNGPDLQTALANDADHVIWKAFSKTFHQIRDLALRHDDASLLHGDPLPRNFIWNPESGCVYAIDPGQAGRMANTAGDLDPILSLFAMHAMLSLQPRRCRGTDPKNGQRLSIFLEPFATDVLDRMLRVNRRISPLSTAYQRFTRYWLARRSGSSRCYVRYSRWARTLIDEQIRHSIDRL